jgi:predicted alpha/beta superfamily hydrolase
MSKRVLGLFFLLLAVVHSGVQAQPATSLHQLDSNVLSEEREYRVTLPSSYGWARDRSYPVLYVLDGRQHHDHTVASVQFLANKGEIPEMIVVAISSTVRLRDYTPTDWENGFAGGGGAPAFRRFLADELIPEIEKNYRTTPFRVFSGHSLGGLFALYLVSTVPLLFDAHIALSPTLNWDDGAPLRLLEQRLKDSEELPTYLYVARSDDSGLYLADFDYLTQLLRTYAPRKFRWSSQAFPQETHGSIPLMAQIAAIRDVYAGYRFHDDLSMMGIGFAEQHYAKLSAMLGTPVGVPEHVLNNIGYAVLAEDQFEEAIRVFNLNVERNPHSANARDSLADAYLEADMRSEAKGALIKAVELAKQYDDPNLAAYRNKLAELDDVK